MLSTPLLVQKTNSYFQNEKQNNNYLRSHKTRTENRVIVFTNRQ